MHPPGRRDGRSGAAGGRTARLRRGRRHRPDAARRARAYIGGLREFYLAGARHTGNAPLASTLAKLYEQVEPLRYLLARQSMERGGIHGYTSGIIEALDGRDFERAAELTRGYVQDVLPGILQAYRRASEQDAEEQAPRLRRA